MLATITLREVLEQMKATDEAGQLIPFSITVIANNKQKKTGGQIIDYPKAIAVAHKGEAQQEQTSEGVPSQPRLSKNPLHFKNSTRNIEEIVGGHRTNRIRKINVMLITHFNGKKMIIQ